MMRRFSLALVVFGLLSAGAAVQAQEMKIAVIGLRHGHAWGHLPKMVRGQPARLVGVSETSQELIAEAKKLGVPDGLIFTDWKEMLAAARPDIVWTFVENNRHREIVEACAPRKIHVMLEKPLAAGFADAVAIREAARKHGIQVLTNYQMAWWPANYVAKKQVDDGVLGTIWRVHAIVGHGGPGGRDVRGRYFLEWLTDPVKNGGGALIDFGCYGAVWSLWFMGTPETVFAQANQLQPERYPKVEDNSTILLRYKNGVAILEGSWDLPAGFQDLEIFSRSGMLRVRREAVELRKARAEVTQLPLEALPPERSEPIAYMVQAVRSGKPLEGIVALDINVNAVEILEAARMSINTGQAVRLPLKSFQAIAAEEPPTEWVEPSTGHRVIRLSREPGSASLYFHQNAYTAAGDKMVFTTKEGLSTIALQTGKAEPLVEGRVSHVVVGKKSRQVFYIQDDTVYATHFDTRATRAIAKMRELRSGSGLTVNADETMLAGSYTEAGPDAARPRPAPGPGESSLEARWAARRPMALYTIHIKTGEVKAFYRSTEWLNHVQFSPTDPALLMFCHEGPWHKVDRIWTIRTDGAGLRKIHARTMDMEIAGHEFWSPDGKIIWYDLQTPKGREFWLAGVVLSSGEKIRYKVEREHWSVHFNASPDGKLFAGDGGGPRSVAAPGNGQRIYLFTPKRGALLVENLVDLARHDYRLEPNVSFTPDGKWIVFRSNLHGTTHVYAVEVAKKNGTGFRK